jgi:hypothetical protein
MNLLKLAYKIAIYQYEFALFLQYYNYFMKRTNERPSIKIDNKKLEINL